MNQNVYAMRIKLPITLLFFLGLWLVACEPEQAAGPDPTLDPDPPVEDPVTTGEPTDLIYLLQIMGEDPCGDPLKLDLIAADTALAGGIRVVNSDEYLFVNYLTNDGWQLERTRLYAGPCADVPLTGAGEPAINQFPYQVDHPDMTTSYTYAIPLADLTDCYCIAPNALVKLFDDNGDPVQLDLAWPDATYFSGSSGAAYLDFCTVECDDPPPPSGDCVGEFHTISQGGWGSPPNGNNPGVYLHAHFADAFPDGLTIGCDYTVHFDSAQNVTDYLPGGSGPAVLDQDYVNPTEKISILVAQVTAMALNVGFDAYDPDFNASDFPFADLVISHGDFEGWSVAEFLALAEEVLGGCNDDYSPSQINSLLSAINGSYQDVGTNGGWLECP